MNRFLIITILLFIVAIKLISQTTSITIYNNNFGVVNEIRELEINKGTSTIKITDVPSSIIPTSVSIKLDGTILEQNYQYDLVSLNSLLQKFIDKEIKLVNNSSKTNELITGKLLSISGNQIVVQTPTNLIAFPNINDLTLQLDNLPDGLLTKPTLVWLVLANKSGKQKIDFSYMTNDIKWEANYVGVLNEDDTEMSFNAWVSIENNSGGTFKDAKLKLIAGEVENNLRGYADYIGYAETPLMPMRAKNSAPEFKEEAFFEYHFYELNNSTTIANNEIKQISLFNIPKIKVKKRLLHSNKWKNNTNGKIDVYIQFDNSKSNNLGMPLPKGGVQIFKTHNNSNEFIGADAIEHTATDEKVDLKVGTAFDVLANEIITNNNYREKISEASYEITYKNRKAEPVEVEVQREVGPNWEILQTSHQWEKVDASTIKYIIKLKPKEEVILKYKIRNEY